jgi:cyclopropane-fatty-acyl-phospholipid synthase
VEVETGRSERALALPLSVLRTPIDGDVAQLLVARDGRAELRRVRVGLRTLDAFEVQEGLSAEDWVLRSAAVQPGQRVLEVGCGWGAVAELAARDFGATVTGVTLSTEQLAFAQQRLQAQGLAGDLRLQDYRDIPDGPFDALVSIEMFEAVGREYWAGYFETVRRQLKPGARACIQTITIRDELFDRYVRGSDFIQQYVFPGGLLPSPSEFRKAAARAGLQVVNELAFGPDYAETLRRWRADFLRHEPQVREQGFDLRFVRLWEFYLAYCEAAFDTGSTDVMQFTLQAVV